MGMDPKAKYDQGGSMKKVKLALLGVMAVTLMASAVVAGDKKPMSKWKCEEFLALDAQFQPKAIYAATELTKKGKPEASIFDVDGTEKVIPIVIAECQKAPKDSFWDKVKAAWKKVGGEVKKAL